MASYCKLDTYLTCHVTRIRKFPKCRETRRASKRGVRREERKGSYFAYGGCYILRKRCLLILRALILESSVDCGIPSLAAAPRGPDTLPLLSARAASIISFS